MGFLFFIMKVPCAFKAYEKYFIEITDCIVLTQQFVVEKKHAQHVS